MNLGTRSWRDKVAVVTGAASGIGLALARRFAAEGMAVVLVDRHADRLRDAKKTLGALGAAEVLSRTIDVTDAPAVGALADEVADALGSVHVLCNNAGVIRPGTAWELSDDNWSTVLAVNVTGVVNGIRAFVPRMLAHGDDCNVVNTASVAGLFAAPSAAAYCASKAAVVALSETLAVDVARIPECRLRVSVLCPGGASTNLFRDEFVRRPDGVSLGETSDRLWAERSSPDRTDQMDPDVVADSVWRALQDGSFWILPMQAAMHDAARARLHGLAAALSATPPVDGRQANDGVLARYYARVDGPVPASALDLVADDLEFCFARPDRRIEGARADLAAYIEERPPLAHRLVRLARDRDVEFAVGESVDGDTSLGTFVASVRTDVDGQIDRYLATFYPGRRIAEES